MAKRIEESDSGSGSASESGSGSGSDSGSGSESGSDSGSGSGSGSDSGSGSGSGSESESGSGSESESDEEKPKKDKPKVKAAPKPKTEKPKKKSPSKPTKPAVKKAGKKVIAADDVESKVDEIDPEKLKGLNEVEKEALILEHYESQTKKSKELALKKKLESEKEALEEDNEVSSRRLRSKDTDSRKSALSNLKSIKQGDKGSKSILSKRFGRDDDSDNEFDGGDSSNRDLAEKRRRRKELQRSVADGAGMSSSYGASSSSTSGPKKDPDHVELEEPDVSGPVEMRHCLAYLYKRREWFEKHYFEPFFEKMVKGNYVRVVIEDLDDGGRVYRFCEVLHMCTVDKEYQFMGETTKRGLMLSYGKEKRAWTLSVLSNHSLTEQEYMHWRLFRKKVGVPIPTKDEARKFYNKIKSMPLLHKYTDEEVTTMVNRKKASGITHVALGVERVRLERDVEAAKGVGNYAKAMELEGRLEKVKAANEKRLAIKTEDVETINKINKRNREINMQRDMDAGATNRAQMDSMSAAQKLQYVRASASKRMYLSRGKIETNLAEGKLIKLEDGRIMTANKLQEVEALPDDIVPETKGKAKEEDVLVKMERKRKLAEATEITPRVAEVQVDGEGTDIANKTIRVKEDDGTWTTMRPAAEILKEQEQKMRPVVSDEAKKARKGLSMKEYFDRVKQRRAEE
ncbi:Aste57867_8816 [Aphanomyces stellatus]|uniref:Aste57867_8816 protein n=1 Tax=Aphanomyces stellatus TaxID=120398 RepID=A0A485KLA0_9STRA|nr:hypothetical protein As57867_008781 [Aphanomyces stellatus]VFT85702.1 Aste57867_8816 [Aphanomyces stellatus]